MEHFAVEDLKVYCKKLLINVGVNEEDARIASESLIQANLEGVHSHGISRLPIYLKRLAEGRINPNPSIDLNEKTHSLLMVNGDNGLGQVVGYHAIKKGIEMAKESGVVVIGVNNSNHFGTASFFCQLACEENLACIGFTNSPSAIAPWGGRSPFFGTNPIAFGFPTGNDTPVIIDLSTSIVARGKIILAAKQGNEIPSGWALDENGHSTTDPNQALDGSVLPLGGAKGSALALGVEILTGILSGAAFGPHVNNIYDENVKDNANVGHFFILLNIEKFMSVELFTTYINSLLTEMKELPKVPGVDEIRYPGERRKKESSLNMEAGIPLSDIVKNELSELGRRVQILFPEPIN
ncbi:Ldh family oxidoreductase [Bacillus sp. OK048]|uniref:Ldh family oxidoreductase n=1 Tax=Bacillus sp. OK048 TaxID=1882761 RepID=UPI00088D06B1|nr:Ldh family oxidoreductase [Bacillus sp. OK048]SDN39802.1 malate dehydrogenase (NAD) [Bacillus sp. OK048]